VADVDAVSRKAPPSTAIARANTTSVYTAAEIFPMLPEKLSTDLTSLGEGEERLAIVIEMDGRCRRRVGKSEVYRARVLNHAKLAYNGVAAWLDGGALRARLRGRPGLDEQLRMQDRVAQAMRASRTSRRADPGHDRGAARVRRRRAGRPASGREESAKELIEDFMIAANG
jgi:exoribonuclease-2